jgi:hypothetical protein
MIERGSQACHRLRIAVVGPTAGGHRAGSGCASETGLVNEVRNKGMSLFVGQWIRIAASVTALIALAVVVVTIYTPPVSRADTCAAAAAGAPLPAPGPDVTLCADVLGLEARWLAAITAGDRDTIASILSPNYKHITSSGRLIDRDQEIAETAKQTFTMTPTEQAVDLASDLAVIHGVNTITQSGKVLNRERFTDVFINQDGGWMALSAQETEI